MVTLYQMAAWNKWQASIAQKKANDQRQKLVMAAMKKTFKPVQVRLF